jgi:F-type H+-transporting ATPase subunit delta
MEDNSTLGRPYAVAAFKVAVEEKSVARWAEMLALLETVSADPTMKGLVANPKVDSRELANLVIDVCGDGLNETGQNFVRILMQNERLGLVPAVRTQFDRERADTEGRSQVEVSTAYALDAAQEKVIVKAMSERLGTDVSLTVTVDETLIGGVMIRAGDLVIDASLRGRLGQLAQSLVV